jgi:hypothetical protein
LAITFEDVHRCIQMAPEWTFPARVFRLAETTAWDLARGDYGWDYPEVRSIFGRPVVIDNSVPRGTVHFEIPVPELPKGLV